MTQTVIETPWLSFVGSNERATPPMADGAVSHDLGVLRALCESMALNEFKLDYYWAQAKKTIGKFSDPVAERWSSFPNMTLGEIAPVVAGQPILWRKSVFERKRVKRALCHAGKAGISETRLIRGAMLGHRDTSLEHWEATAHFVVGGDADTDSPTRKKILRKNIRRFARFIGKLVKTGRAVIGYLDANIHRGTWAYTAFMRALAPYKPKFHGELGVEYLFTIDGKDTKIEVRRDFTVKPKSHGGPLRTDHEARGIVYRLRGIANA